LGSGDGKMISIEVLTNYHAKVVSVFKLLFEEIAVVIPDYVTDIASKFTEIIDE
jgi:hypothetical protein